MKQLTLSLPLAGLLATALLLAAGCKAPQAFGDRNSIIVRAEQSLWAQVDSAVVDALEQRSFTTRAERIFQVTFVAADDTLWRDLRAWQQVVVLGTRGDDTVERILRAADRSDASSPALVQTTDIWALEQLVTLLLLPDTDQAEAVDRLLPELFASLVDKYDEWIFDRLYTTGVDDSLTQALSNQGFSLELPRVYMASQQDSLFHFTNPYRQGDTDLLRSILLTWKTGGGDMSQDSLQAWRENIDETYYEPSQDILETGIRRDSIQVGGRPALELRGVWQDRSDFPAAGPFIARSVACPEQDRTYYMDAWVFAPGKDKYPYVRQLGILLDSFRCVDGGPTAASDPAIAHRTAG
ncbi:MAG: DUF4837 family protein [Gemmatimonadales bacterium]|jgi:hypothetical protein